MLFLVWLMLGLHAVWINGHEAPYREDAILKGDTSLGFLPGDLYPIHYNIELQPDFYSPQPPFPLTGSVDITFECIEESSILYLNVWDLDVHGSSVYVTVDPDSPVQVPDPGWSRWEVDETLRFFQIFMDDNLLAGAVYHVGLSYNGTVNERGDGGVTYGSYESVLDGSTPYVVSSQFQAQKARRAFPGFDEPIFKATYNITVLRQDPMTALSNMPLAYTETRPDGWLADHFETSLYMSAYLLCITVGQLAYHEAFTVNGTVVRIYGRPELIDDLVMANQISAATQDWFGEWTGLEDPLSKVDHIEAPERGGAMEHWGLITYSEQAIYHNPDLDYLFDLRRLGSVVAHELAHFWFGNLVTCSWWNDMWLNEGFASFFQSRPFQNVLGIPESDHHVLQNQRQIMQLDSKNESQTVWKVLDSPLPITGYSSTYTYKKGAGLLLMMQQFLGDSTFQKGIQRYLNEYAYGSAETSDFFSVMTEQADIDGVTDTDGLKLFVEEKMDPWLTQMGYPLITLTRTSASTVEASQSLFLSPPGQMMPESPYGYEWHVPLTIANQETLDWSGQTRAWLNRENKTISEGLPSSPDQWFVANIDGEGYYRVKYDNTTYRQLVDQLDTDASVIPYMTRYTILNDAFEITRAGLEPEVYAMETTRFMDQEDNFVVWDTANYFLDYSSLVLARYPDTFGLFQTYLVSKVDPVYAQLGWTNNPEDNTVTREARALILWLACSYGNVDCITQAQAQFDQFKQNPALSIHPDHRLTVYCTALRTAPQEDWDFLHSIYLNLTGRADRWIPDEVDRILAALACPEDTALLQRYIDLTFDRESITADDDTTAINALVDSGSGRWVLWEHMKTNWESGTLPQGVNKLTILRDVAEGFASEEDLVDLQNFIDQNPPINENHEKAFQDSLDSATKNKQWADNNEQDLNNWLQNHVSEHDKTALSGGNQQLRHFVSDLHEIRKLGQYLQ